MGFFFFFLFFRVLLSYSQKHGYEPAMKCQRILDENFEGISIQFLDSLKTD